MTFDYLDGEILRKKVEDYFRILKREDITQTEITEEFLDIFTLEK